MSDIRINSIILDILLNYPDLLLLLMRFIVIVLPYYGELNQT